MITELYADLPIVLPCGHAPGIDRHVRHVRNVPKKDISLRQVEKNFSFGKTSFAKSKKIHLGKQAR
jgi:hypothetical protein